MCEGKKLSIESVFYAIEKNGIISSKTLKQIKRAFEDRNLGSKGREY